MTLLHQIAVKQITDEKTEFQIRCGIFGEKPQIKNQMIHFCVFPETELWELEKFIRFCAAMKFTHIVVEFWGMFRYGFMKELSWNHAYSKEQLLPLFKMANDLGIEIIPMFNHWGHASASRVMHGKHVVLDRNPRLQPLFTDDGWNWNIQNPDAIQVLKNIRKELIDLCGPGDYFHLGCDEAYNYEHSEENHHILTDYLNGISEELAAEGRRPIIWGDMLVSHHESFNKNNHYTTSCKNVELEKLILSNLSRDIIIADWQYNVKESPVETALIFKEAGFDTLICPWDSIYGVKSVAPCVNTAMNSELYGVLHTTWHTLSKGMVEISKVAYRVWNDVDETRMPSHEFFATNTAKILRKVYFANGDYEKSGWSKKQIDSIVM